MWSSLQMHFTNTFISNIYLFYFCSFYNCIFSTVCLKKYMRHSWSLSLSFWNFFCFGAIPWGTSALPFLRHRKLVLMLVNVMFYKPGTYCSNKVKALDYSNILRHFTSFMYTRNVSFCREENLKNHSFQATARTKNK